MKGIKEKLARIGTLAGSGDALERDLALQLLREVYAEIKFAAAPAAVEESAAVVAMVDEPALEGEDCGAPETEEPDVEEPDIEEPAAEEFVTTAAEEPLVVPRRVAPDVIRSLYGTEEESETEQEPEPEIEPQPEPKPAPDEKPRATLGDVVAAGHRTLGETLRKGEPDMSAHMAVAGKEGLKRSIGLNDRFLIIRDVFDGDSAAFNAAIDRLDGFTDLDEAVIWIRGNIDRSADNEGMQLLVALVESKFGH